VVRIAETRKVVTAGLASFTPAFYYYHTSCLPEGQDVKEHVRVLFRVWSEDASDVFALFPDEPGTPDPETCMCYQHVGQHGSAHYQRCIAMSRPALAGEYEQLLTELEGRGYEVQIMKRAAACRRLLERT
jgi:hypothetical protein